MGAHNPVTLSTNTLSHHPTTPTNAERTIETCVPHPTISDRQPLCELYRYILNDSKQGQRGRFAHSPGWLSVTLKLIFCSPWIGPLGTTLEPGGDKLLLRDQEVA